MIERDLQEEYYNRLKEHYEPEELVDELNLDFDTVWDAFYEQLLDNKKLLIKMGIEEDDE